MKRLSKIIESVWSDMEDRGTEEVLKREDGVLVLELVIDGVKYRFNDQFMGMGDTYVEEEGKEWTGFAFNKMPNGSSIIKGDTDAAGVFGSNNYDFGDVGDYDVYVLRDYIDNTKENLIKLSVNVAFEPCPEHYYVDGLHETIERYVRDIYENHMSDYAQYCLVCITDSEDWIPDHFVLNLSQGTDLAEFEVVKDEFAGRNIFTAHMYLYPQIKGWTENLENDLKKIYEKSGWTKSESFEVDYSIVPSNSSGICFVMFDDDEEPEEVSESVWDDMQDRGTGDKVKSEDEIDVLSVGRLTEYLNDTYYCSASDTVAGIDDNGYIHMTMFMDDKGLFREIYYNGSDIIVQVATFEVMNCEDEMKHRYNLKQCPLVFRSYNIYPKDNKEITNTFFLKVLDDIMSRIKPPLRDVVKKKISESVWDDMQDRGTGDTVKKEDEFNPEYIDFGENTTVYWAKESLVLGDDEKFSWYDIKDYNNNGWRLPTLEEVKQVNWPKVNVSWYEHGWHIRFEDGNEIKVITDGSEPSMWTSSYEQRINTVSVYYYGYGGSRFNINSCIPYSKDFVILVKDKK